MREDPVSVMSTMPPTPGKDALTSVAPQLYSTFFTAIPRSSKNLRYKSGTVRAASATQEVGVRGRAANWRACRSSRLGARLTLCGWHAPPSHTSQQTPPCCPPCQPRTCVWC